MGARWVIVLACQRNGVWVLVHVVFIVSTLYLFVAEVHATAVCEPEVARVVSAQGMVELRRASQTNWQAVTLNTLLCAGDMLRVRSRSRAALRLSNESMLRLDQKTTITFPERAADKAFWLLDLIKGALHIITRTPKPFKVRTPFLNGAVDGTEFYVGMDENSTTMVLYEGQITTSNAQGRLVLTGHEAAKAVRNQAPQRIAIVKPTDAVQWALYYPTILDYTLNRQNEASAEVAVQPALQAALSYARQGRSYDALSVLDQVPQNERTVDFYIAQSSLFLSVGRVDEATASLIQAQQLASNSNSADYNSEVNALKAIVAVVQNDKAQALKLTQQAVDLNDTSPTAWLALSYAQQAHFEIEAALTSVQKAVQLDKRNALAWARLAELYMSMSELDQALNAAQKAVDLNPDLAKTQTVLGFAYLLKIDTETAKSIFTQAIALDQADPLPRLGMGLALIREGELEAGRVELEIAASLDPANSLIRSYLGKAYFEEKRYDLSSTQFDLAKKRDPNDPTPWFYDAIQKQTQNRPVEALQDIQKSIELNDNRAVYRSKLLLDQDQAGRGSSLARIYNNLGFEKRALMETAKSLSFDPANHSAHRFLSDTSANIPRHEIARVSELLQAQLLQPINVNPVQPHSAVADLNIITGTGPSAMGFNEFAPLMERNKSQLVASGVVGNNGTLGDEVVFSTLHGNTSVSLGQFHYQTNGFRDNNDQRHNIYNAFIQHAFTPKFNIQAEVRTREKKYGDLVQNFDKDNFSKTDQTKLNDDMARLGMRYKISTNQNFIASAMYNKRKINGSSEQFNFARKNKNFQIEAQYLHREKYFNIVLGGGVYRLDSDENKQVQPLVEFPCTNCGFTNTVRKKDNFYIYSNLNFPENVTTTLGLSYDSYKRSSRSDSIEDLSFNKLNPKIGLQWKISGDLMLRLAWFKAIKNNILASQSIEPTQIAGFNQFFDDPNGTRTERKGIGLDYRPTSTLLSGIEASIRHLMVPIFPTNDLDKQKEQLYRAYLYFLFHSNWSANAEFQFEKLNSTQKRNDVPHEIESMRVPVSINYFNPNGFFSRLVGTYVNQNLTQSTKNLHKSNDFFLVDAVVGYRFPSRRGLLSVEVRNLLNKSFQYRDSWFFVSEQPAAQFVPTRTIFVRLTLNF